MGKLHESQNFDVSSSVAGGGASQVNVVTDGQSRPCEHQENEDLLPLEDECVIVVVGVVAALKGIVTIRERIEGYVSQGKEEGWSTGQIFRPNEREKEQGNLVDHSHD